MSHSLTRGVHHVGLTVTDLDSSCGFFTELLGWEKVGGNPDYPAVFVSDGSVMVTLWQANPHIVRRIWILGASWQSRLDDRPQIHNLSYGSRGIVQDATPACS